MGKVEGKVCAEEDYTGLQEDHSSQADECSYAEEIVGHDEGKMGREEEGDVDAIKWATWLKNYERWKM